jgi:hypothetical protein
MKIRRKLSAVSCAIDLLYSLTEEKGDKNNFLVPYRYTPAGPSQCGPLTLCKLGEQQTFSDWKQRCRRYMVVRSLRIRSQRYTQRRGNNSGFSHNIAVFAPPAGAAFARLPESGLIARAIPEPSPILMAFHSYIQVSPSRTLIVTGNSGARRSQLLTMADR